jgi:hypothetical protein
MADKGFIRMFFLGTFMLCLVSGVRADGLEYRCELGVMGGMSSYYGDANYHVPFKNINAMGGVVWRYNINPRMAVKSDFAVAGISGSTADYENRYPGGDVEFTRAVYELGAQFEYNFLAYGDGVGYKKTRRLAPYIFAGLGITYAPKPEQHVIAANVPVGMGVKWKVVQRLNVGCELSYRFTFSDNLDVTHKGGTTLDDPYGINSGIMKNKDGYSFLSLFVTYDLSPKYRKCNN